MWKIQLNLLRAYIKMLVSFLMTALNSVMLSDMSVENWFTEVILMKRQKSINYF